MKLITHNMLLCNKKTCQGKNNFPLRLVVTKMEEWNDERAMDYNSELMKRMCDKVEWKALKQTVAQVSPDAQLQDRVERRDP